MFEFACKRLSYALLLAATLVVPSAFAQNAWQPTSTVKIIVPAGPGASLDTTARIVKAELEAEKALTQPVVVYNKAGGGGALMLHEFNEHVGDGNLLGIQSFTILTSKITGMTKRTYSDYTPLVVLFDEYVAIAVRADSPVKNARDLVAHLKKDPGALSIGVATAIGNHIHIGAALPLKAAGVNVKKLRVIAYKSSMQSLAAVLGGDLDAAAATVGNMVPLMQAGKIRIIAISSPKRLGGALASVPTWREQGIPADFVATQGIIAPKNLTPEQVSFWVHAFSTMSQSADYRKRLEKMYRVPDFKSGVDARRSLDEQYAKAKEILTELGLAKD